jgi:hypothetical protein
MQTLFDLAARLGFNEWLSLISAFVALVSFGLSARAVRRQEAMQFESLRADHDGRLIDWADEAIAAIADSQRHCRDLKNGLLTEGEGARNASELRTRLSALLDRGRLFFPNQPDSAGEEADATSEAAYAGQAHGAIDALYKVYRVISDFGRVSPLTAGEAVNAVVAERRRFVSEIFRSVDPRRRQAALSALSGQSRVSR